jgi:hypothetical protein
MIQSSNQDTLFVHVTETQVAILEAAASGSLVDLTAASTPHRPGPDDP